MPKNEYLNAVSASPDDMDYLANQLDGCPPEARWLLLHALVRPVWGKRVPADNLTLYKAVDAALALLGGDDQ